MHYLKICWNDPVPNHYNLYLSHLNLHLLQLSKVSNFFSSLPKVTSGLVSPCIIDPAICDSNRQKDRQPGSMFYYNRNKIIVSSQHTQSHPWQKKLRAVTTHSFSQNWNLNIQSDLWGCHTYFRRISKED